MKNFVELGETLKYTAGSAISSGDPVMVNDLFCVAVTDIAATESGALKAEGVCSIRKDSSTISQGDNLYWDADGNPVSGASGIGALTTTATGNTYAGKAWATAASGVATVNIKLNA